MNSSAPSVTPAPGVGWLADRGDGTYRNPVLFADYSDPDAIRVGDDYWLTASSFNHVPGLPILHSIDLVNWRIVNHALPQLVPVDHFSRPRHGCGVWAPAIRYHQNKYWIYYPDPDFGLYVVTADDPAGAWSAPVMVKAGKGLIDPCPYWDEQGQGYLIHAWAKSRSGIKNRLTLHRLNAASTAVTDEGVVVVDGDKIPGWHTLEGPKLYRRNGYFYIFAPAGGVREGYQAVFRARELSGPYESRIVLVQGRTHVNGPHQGAWVDTPAGEHAFLHFQELPAFGRVVHLQPMRWVDDWPVMGSPGAEGAPGEPVNIANIPASGPRRAALPPVNACALTPGREWQWQGNPRPDWYRPLDGGLSWRLACVPLERDNTLWLAPQLLLQKFAGPAFIATTTVKLHDRSEGDRAGLIVFGHDYAWIGLRRWAGRVSLVMKLAEGANQGELALCVATAEAGTEPVTLRVSVDAAARCEFSFSRDGRGFEALGPVFQATSSTWVGAKVGVFAAAAPKPALPEAGWAEFGPFQLHVID